MSFPNWTIVPSDGGFSWRVWEGEAEERGHATTKETAMDEIQESCRRVGQLDTVPSIFVNEPYWNTDKLRTAIACIADAQHAIDQEAWDKSLKRATDLISEVIEEEHA